MLNLMAVVSMVMMVWVASVRNCLSLTDHTRCRQIWERSLNMSVSLVEVDEMLVEASTHVVKWNSCMCRSVYERENWDDDDVLWRQSERKDFLCEDWLSC